MCPQCPVCGIVRGRSMAVGRSYTRGTVGERRRFVRRCTVRTYTFTIEGTDDYDYDYGYPVYLASISTPPRPGIVLSYYCHSREQYIILFVRVGILRGP